MANRRMIVVAFCVLFLASYLFGLFGRYNCISALVDLSRDDVRIVSKGHFSHSQLQMRLSKDYGFTWVIPFWEGFLLHGIGPSMYNRLMKGHLEKNNPSWKSDYRREYGRLVELEDSVVRRIKADRQGALDCAHINLVDWDLLKFEFKVIDVPCKGYRRDRPNGSEAKRIESFSVFIERSTLRIMKNDTASVNSP